MAFGFPLESVSVRWHQNPGGIAPAGYTHARLPVPDDIEGRGAEAALPLMVQMMSGPAAEAQAAPNFKLERVCHNPRGREDASATAAVALSSLDQAPVALEAERDATDALVAECVALCNRAKAEATRFVAENRAAIKAVAAALIRKASLSGDEVAALVAAAQG